MHPIKYYLSFFLLNLTLISNAQKSCYPFYHERKSSNVIGNSKNKVLGKIEKKGGAVSAAGASVGAVASITGLGGIILSAVAWPLTILGVAMVAGPKVYKKHKKKPLITAKKLIKQAYIYAGEQHLPGSKNFKTLRIKGIKRASGIKKDPIFFQLWDHIKTRDDGSKAKDLYKDERQFAQAIIKADKSLIFCQPKRKNPDEKELYTYNKIASMILNGELESKVKSQINNDSHENHWKKIIKNSPFT